MEYTPAKPLGVAFNPVSSRTSRTTASSGASPHSRPPPGRPHAPASGSGGARRTTSRRPSTTHKPWADTRVHGLSFTVGLLAATSTAVDDDARELSLTQVTPGASSLSLSRRRGTAVAAFRKRDRLPEPLTPRLSDRLHRTTGREIGSSALLRCGTVVPCGCICRHSDLGTALSAWSHSSGTATGLRSSPTQWMRLRRMCGKPVFSGGCSAQGTRARRGGTRPFADYFVDSPRLATELRRYDVVWLRGGNAFMLRYALARSSADAELTRLLQEDAVVYSGYSAGPCVLAPSLHGLETVDSPDVVRDVYDDRPISDGLAVLDYTIVPHVNSPDHPESEALGLVAERYRATGVPHRTLRDGEVLLIEGATSSICG